MLSRFVTRVRESGESGQSTAEYALVILGAVAIATLLINLGDREPRDLAAVRLRDRKKCCRRDRASLVPRAVAGGTRRHRAARAGAHA